MIQSQIFRNGAKTTPSESVSPEFNAGDVVRVDGVDARVAVVVEALAAGGGGPPSSVGASSSMMQRR